SPSNRYARSCGRTLPWGSSTGATSGLRARPLGRDACLASGECTRSAVRLAHNIAIKFPSRCTRKIRRRQAGRFPSRGSGVPRMASRVPELRGKGAARIGRMNVERVTEPGAEWDEFAESCPTANPGHASGWSQVMRRSYHLHMYHLVAREVAGNVAGILAL